MGLLRGIISVLQTPFDEQKLIDYESYARLIESGINDGVDGYLAPVVASEVAYLERHERESLVRFAARQIAGRVPLIVGASAAGVSDCRDFAALAETIGAHAYLISVPAPLYGGTRHEVVEFFRQASEASILPLIIQDLEFNGPGLPLETIIELREALPNLAGIKIETSPAGPKYTAVRQALGTDFSIAGGWAVTQMLEAMDRGVDAMIPESSMIEVYAAIHRFYRRRERDRARRLFWALLPVLAFSNQTLDTSIVFFKRLLVRREIFCLAQTRCGGLIWDEYLTRAADELINYYLNEVVPQSKDDSPRRQLIST